MSPAPSRSKKALLAALEEGPVVRMYRPKGLGDCFLLALPPADDPRFVLIDCGVFFATTGGSARMCDVAEDLADVTDEHLHLLVATHEHWDHLSGFQFARKTFDRFTVDEVWVAWTEDPEHPLAQELKRKKARTTRAVAAAAAHLRGLADSEADALEGVLGFDLGVFDPVELAGRALGASGTRGQMEYVCTNFGTPRYLKPGGEPIRWPDHGVRFYVLGPPEDRELLERSDPSEATSEVYETHLALSSENAFAVAALGAVEPGGLTADEEELLARSQPFDKGHRLPLDAMDADGDENDGGDDDPLAGRRDFFRRHYGFSAADDDAHGPRWRRIGAAWMTAASQLALQLNDDTNNTSLALAIELVADGRVLLFPADAQVGNWLSWHQHTWHRDDGREVDATDLLSRTVLYKVGHHGSHNSTLRERGLELMNHPELVAMIPVDSTQAEAKEWAMPFGPLAERLREKTSGRILRADDGLPERPGNVTEADWKRFAGRVKEDDLWVQYQVPGGDGVAPATAAPAAACPCCGCPNPGRDA